MKTAVFILLVAFVVGTCLATNNRCSEQKSYDIIVVGSGIGGSVAAKRAAAAGYSVLLIERGPDYNTAPASAPGSQVAVFNNAATGPVYASAAQTQLNNHTFNWKDVSYVGGASSINGMIHARGDAQRYFDTFWPANWNWNVMQNYFALYENFTGPNPDPIRGTNGPVKVSQYLATDGGGRVQNIINAAQTVFPNIPVKTDMHIGTFAGVAPPEFTAFGGARSSAYTSYVQDSVTSGEVELILNYRVNKINFNGCKAKSVEVQAVNTTAGTSGSQTCVIRAKQAVIVCAGAIGTPKLLKLSGVGPAAELQSLGIPVVAAIEDVGRNLQDHVSINLLYTPPAPFNASVNNNYGQIFYNVADNPSSPNDFYAAFPSIPIGGGNALNLVSVNLLYPESSGTVKLMSTTPSDKPIVNPNYLSTQRDRTTFGTAVQKCLAVAQSLGFTPLTNPCATGNCSTPESTLQTYINALAVGTGYHWAGTAAIGRAVDPYTLAVYGTSKLYVLDGSILPAVSGAGTQTTIYAVAERGIELILGNLEDECVAHEGED